jgi:hypothetical protein
LQIENLAEMISRSSFTRRQPPSGPYLLWIIATTLAARAVMFSARLRKMLLRGRAVYRSLALPVIKHNGTDAADSAPTAPSV